MHNGEIVLTFLLTDAETAECFFSEALNPAPNLHYIFWG